jgi:hypothetical protein
MAKDNRRIVPGLENWQGYLTPQQKSKLRIMQMLGTLRYSTISLCIFMFWLLVFRGKDVQIGILIPGLFIDLIAILGFLISTLLGIETWVNFKSDINENKVIYLDGVVALDTLPRIGRYDLVTVRYGLGIEPKNEPIIMLVVEDQKFKLPANTRLGFRNGERYRVFFAPRTKTYLNAVPLNNENLPNLEKRKNDQSAALAEPNYDQVVGLGDDGELIFEDKPKR